MNNINLIIINSLLLLIFNKNERNKQILGVCHGKTRCWNLFCCWLLDLFRQMWQVAVSEFRLFVLKCLPLIAYCYCVLNNYVGELESSVTQRFGWSQEKPLIQRVFESIKPRGWPATPVDKTKETILLARKLGTKTETLCVSDCCSNNRLYNNVVLWIMM